MQTITQSATAAAPILAIDLGKYKSVACVYRSAEDLRFLSIPTSRGRKAKGASIGGTVGKRHRTLRR
jgi:hypothetical protein